MRVFRVIPAVTEGVKYSLLRDTLNTQNTDIDVYYCLECKLQRLQLYGVKPVRLELRLNRLPRVLIAQVCQ